MGTFRFKSDLRIHQAIVQPRLYDSLMVTQITLTTKRRPSRALLPKASRASASPAPPISKHVFFPGVSMRGMMNDAPWYCFFRRPDEG